VNGSISSVDVADRLDAEDLARARWYSFFSRWFLAPPDQQAVELFMQPADRFRCTHPASDHTSESAPQAPSVPSSSTLTQTSHAYPAVDSAQSRLESVWQTFSAAVAAAPLESMRSCYDDTFISVGEAPVSLHASVYLTGFANEQPLAEVRQWLAGQGIQASQAGLLTEDHLGLLCEAMAWLIIERGNADPVAADASQQFLFQRFITPVYEEFNQRLADAPDAGVYRELGQLFSAFCAIERQAFDIDR
jgi:TorA maturation chaperone TorD